MLTSGMHSQSQVMLRCRGQKKREKLQKMRVRLVLFMTSYGKGEPIPDELDININAPTYNACQNKGAYAISVIQLLHTAN
jgi:hypothetical protein